MIVVAEILRLTVGKDVDYVLCNIGVMSISNDILLLRQRGRRIGLIGFLKRIRVQLAAKYARGFDCQSSSHRERKSSTLDLLTIAWEYRGQFQDRL